MTNYDRMAFAQWNVCIELSRYSYDAPHGNFSRPRRWTLRQLRQIYDEAFAGARMFMRVCGKMPATNGKIRATTENGAPPGFGPGTTLLAPNSHYREGGW